MPVIVTTMHDAAALRATCHRLSLDPPTEGSVWLGNRELFGWLVHLPGMYAPLVCDTLTGLVAYHHRDNEFRVYAHIMRFVHRFLRRPGAPAAVQRAAGKSHLCPPQAPPSRAGWSGRVNGRSLHCRQPFHF